MEASRSSVKSLPCYLSASSPLPKEIYLVLWKSNSLSRISILSWILLNHNLNTADILQKKKRKKRKKKKMVGFMCTTFHLLKTTGLIKLLNPFSLRCVFLFKCQKIIVLQLLAGPSFPLKPHLLWVNAIKASCLGLYMERNTWTFEEKYSSSVDVFESAWSNAWLWCSL